MASAQITFTLSWHPTFLPWRYISSEHPDSLYFSSYCTGGMEAARKAKNTGRRSVLSTLPAFPEVFRYFGIIFPGPHGPHFTCSGYRLDSDSKTWALTNICSAPDWRRWRSLCVYILKEVQGERQRSAAGRQRVFMRACFDQGKFNEACACFWDSAA